LHAACTVNSDDHKPANSVHRVLSPDRDVDQYVKLQFHSVVMFHLRTAFDCSLFICAILVFNSRMKCKRMFIFTDDIS